MNDRIIGVSAFSGADGDRIKSAGIDTIRVDFSFPFVDRLGGTLSEAYLKEKEEAKVWVGKGLRLMGVSPLIGYGGYRADDQQHYRFHWNSLLPTYMGEPNTDELSHRYQELCAFLAEDLRGLVSVWQIANELDIPMFAGPLQFYYGCELILHGAAGLKSSDPSLIVGFNMAGAPSRLFFCGRLFANPRAASLDYCGIDGYFGTWDAGGPESWDERLTELYELTHARILVNEWGFSSAGALMSEEEKRSGVPECQLKKWRYGWGEGHTPQSQAQFVSQTWEVFHKHRQHLLGAFFYRWEDQESCWQCRQPDCPVETAWGLVDREGVPKPAYAAFCEGVRKFRGD